MKKILFVSLNDHVPWGGSEELWSKTAKCLNSNFNVSVLVKKWDVEPNQIIDLNKAGVLVVYKNNYNIKDNGWFYKKKWRKLFKIKNREKIHDLDLIDDIESYHLVVISIGDSFEGKLPRYTDYLKKRNVKYVIVVQLATDLRIVNDNLSLLLKKAYEGARVVYFLSKDNVDKTEMLLGCELVNKKYINNPFNFDQEYVSIENPDSQFNIACVASLICFHKSQDLLISVLGQEKWKNRNLVLNIYGDGINRAQICRLVSLYGLETKVNVVGFEQDKSKIWKNNSALVMPSRMEGQSLAMLEAMSFGRMVISTKVGDSERLIIDGETGFFIEAPNFRLIDLVLEKAWEKRFEWQEMGKRSRERLFNVITIEPVLDFSNEIRKIVK